MANTNIKVTSITLHKTSLGDQMAITYAVIGENGNVISQNKRAETVVGPKAEEIVKKLYDFSETYIKERE